MKKKEGQFRVTLTIKDDFSPREDSQWSCSFPSHKTLASAIIEFNELRKVIDEHKLQKLETKEHLLLIKGK